jgi:hypothetical protein
MRIQAGSEGTEFSTMDEFIAIISKKIRDWDAILASHDIFELFVAREFKPQVGPTYLPEDIWSFSLEELGRSYFSSTGWNTPNPSFSIGLCIGIIGEGSRVEEPIQVKEEPKPAKKETRLRLTLRTEPTVTRKRSLQDFHEEYDGNGLSSGGEMEDSTAPETPQFPTLEEILEESETDSDPATRIRGRKGAEKYMVLVEVLVIFCDQFCIFLS